MDESKIFRYTVYIGAILFCLVVVWFLLGIPGRGDGGFDRIEEGLDATQKEGKTH